MRKILKLLYTCFIIISIISCNNNYKKQQDDIAIDNGKVLITSLTYILKQKSLPKEYYNQPLQIVKSSKYHIVSTLKINGINCILLPENTNISSLLKHIDVFKPIPLVEVAALTVKDNLIHIEIILRSTGHNFKLKLKTDENKKYQILEFKEVTI